MADVYRVNEVFWSPQGEGMRAGQMSCFVRFTGCNMRCACEPGPRSPGGFDCDTEFESGLTRTRAELVEQVLTTIRTGMGAAPDVDLDGLWVVLTGGEPALQADAELVSALQDHGLRVAIETNGSVNVDGLGLDWITVSPKVAEHALRQLTADEVKYVRGEGQALPRTRVKAKHYLISPAFNGLCADAAAVRWCALLVQQDPNWRLCAQLHKLWRVR